MQLSADEEEQLLHWRSFIKARLHRLVLLLEKVSGVDWCHPLPWPVRSAPAAARKSATEAAPAGSKEASDGKDVAAAGAAVGSNPDASVTSAPCGCSFFLGLRLSAAAAGSERTIDLRPAAMAFITLVAGWDEKSQLCPTAKCMLRHTAQTELPRSFLGGVTGLPLVDRRDVLALQRSDGSVV